MPTLLAHRRTLPIAIALLCAVGLLAGPAGRFWVALATLLFAPGYLIERTCHLELPTIARPAVWLGLSGALVPLLYLWLTAAGLAVGPGLLWPLCLALIAALLWTLWRTAPQLPPWPKDSMAALGLLLVALAIWTRMSQIEGLAFPAWVDSIHHALLIRITGESGQVPYALQPYLPVDSLTYHWGYHAFAAALWRMSGLSLPTLMLWLGQALSALYAVAFAGLAALLWRRPAAIAVAVCCVLFLSLMPGYFISWGRYTFLYGLLLLPAAQILAWYGVGADHRRWFAPLTLALIALFLVHILAAALAILWCAAVWLVRAPTAPRRWRSAALLWAAGLLTMLLTSPWMAALLARTATETTGPARLQGSESYSSYSQAAGLYWTSDNRMLTALALLGALLALALLGPLRRKAAATVVVWGGLAALLANPTALGLPYLTFFNNNVLALALFVPFTLLLAAGAAAIDEALTQALQTWWVAVPATSAERAKIRERLRIWRLLRLAFLAALAIWGAFDARAMVNYELVLARPEDVPALEWAAANLPPDARVAINTDGWLNDVARGTDAGWWLLPFAGRHTSTPPVIYTYGDPAYIAAVRADTNWLRAAQSVTADEVAAWMQSAGYRYAFATPSGRVFNSQQLVASPRFTVLFESPAATIFQLN